MLFRSLWYTFTTNSLGGQVDVQLTDMGCGANKELSVVVLDFGVPCDATTYDLLQPCEHDSVDFTMSVANLPPNTQYWIVVAGVLSGGIVADCGFNITVSGPGADIIGVDFSAGPDVTLDQGGSTQLLATGGTTYDWSPLAFLSGNGTASPYATPNESTLYTEIGRAHV